MTAIRGYLRLGGLPDNPRTDPQDRAWFGPHDRLFVEEESEPIEFVPGPDYGEFPTCSRPLSPLGLYYSHILGFTCTAVDQRHHGGKFLIEC